MKKFINILLIIASIFSFYIKYDREISNENIKMQEIESKLPYSYKIVIPTSVNDKNKEETYVKIVDILNKFNASIYYDRLSEDKNLKIKYIYDTNDKYLKQISMKSGRVLNEEDMNSNNFISTKKNSNANQIGVIATFNKNIDRDIKTLKSILNDGFNFSGSCQIVFDKSTNVDLFIKELEESLNIKGIYTIDNENIHIERNNNYKWLIMIIYLIVMLLILYDLLNSYKEIGIRKLLGYSSKKIYFERITNLIKVNLIISVSTLIIMGLIFFNQFNIYLVTFIFAFVGDVLLQSLILAFICSIACIYINFITINTLIKNRKPLNFILILNYIAKVCCLVVLIFFIIKCINNFTILNERFSKSFNNWEYLDNFASISSLKMTYEEFQNQDFIDIQKKLYQEFNQRGAILANFNEYSLEIRKVNYKETNYYYERDNVFINPNYLKLYKIYDENNNPINISEEDSDFIMLVPEKYKNDKEKILRYADFWKKSEYYSISTEQKSRIIWIKSNQKIFTTNINIHPELGNEVIDPILHIITENNLSSKDYNFIMTSDGNPFKIKAENGMNPEMTIREIFKKYNIEKYVGDITLVNEQVASDAKNIKDNLKLLSIVSLILLAILLTIIVQNVYNYFDKFSSKLAIEKLCGYKIIHKHINFLLGTIITWNIVFVLSLYIYHKEIVKVSVIIIFGFIFESIFSLIILCYVEKKKVSKTIKGD